MINFLHILCIHLQPNNFRNEPRIITKVIGINLPGELEEILTTGSFILAFGCISKFLDFINLRFHFQY